MANKTLWRNWGGNLKYRPSKVSYPDSEKKIVKLVKKCAAKKRKIRAIGSGHSWTPLCETDQILVSLDEYQGIESVDQDKMQATVFAGTKIQNLTALLFKHGLAMENLGDIDVQSIAGAISTGTHGTGISMGNIPTQVVAMDIVIASGEVVHCSEEENQDIFKAAQICLGTLGIISKITLQCVPAYKLKYDITKESVEDGLENLADYIANNRNYEFYWFPHTNTIQNKFSNITDEPAQKSTPLNFINDYVLENGLFGAISAVTRVVPRTSKSVAKLSAAAVGTVSKVNWSHLVYATPRLVKFNEMEYNIPIESFNDVFLEVVDAIERYQFKVHFPLENRFLKGDDIYLSPAYQRDSAHISLHVYKGKAYQKYFKTMEAIFLNNQGRPHWAKMHNLTAEQLAPRYPMWNKFLAIRQQLDPKGMFLNAYLMNLLGVEMEDLG